jgi:electron transport complex protein RnfB
MMPDGNREIDRRGFLGDGVRIAGAVGLGGVAGVAGLRAALKGQARGELWQIDPDKCVACDQCQALCVLEPSAVKCVQCFPLCGYCDVCTGYFPLTDFELNSGAENQLCPTGAIARTFVEEQAGVRYFEYTIDELLCIGCGKCVKGCELMNGSLYMQVRQDLCVNCNECAIAVGCPAQALYRVPAARPVLLKKKAREALQSRTRRLSQQIAAEPSQEKARELKASKKKVEALLKNDARDILNQRAENG